MTHAHTRPEFGCPDCISSEREATLAYARKTEKPPLCPECSRVTEWYDSDPRTMTLFYVCTAGFTRDAEPICDGGVEVKVR